jgi:twitching motility protein PilT
VTELDVLLKHLVEAGASDLIVKAGAPPRIRLNGTLQALDVEPLAPADVPRLLDGVASRARVEELEANGETEFAYGVGGLGRFRINAFRQRGTLALTCRRVVPGIPSPTELGLPAVLDRVCGEGAGLVLVTGPSGSGVTTTVSSLVDHVNGSRSCQIVTVEHPIEFLHPDKKAVVLQRELGTDTPSVAAAVSRAVRQGADVVAVGEVSDAAALRAVLDAAEAGALVLAAVPVLAVTEALVRLVEAFPDDERRRVRATLSRVLRAVFGQRLLDRADGRGKVAAFEVLLGTTKVEDCIAEDRLDDLPKLVAEGEYHGMQTLDQGLEELARAGLVSVRDAIAAANDAEEVKLALGSL